MSKYGHPIQREGGRARAEAAAVEIPLSANQLKLAKSKANASGNSRWSTARLYSAITRHVAIWERDHEKCVKAHSNTIQRVNLRETNVVSLYKTEKG